MKEILSKPIHIILFVMLFAFAEASITNPSKVLEEEFCIKGSSCTLSYVIIPFVFSKHVFGRLVEWILDI